MTNDDRRLEPLTVHQTNIPSLDVVPAHILLSNTDIELATARDHQEARLRTQLEAVQEDYDHVIIDCLPALSWLIVNALAAAEEVISAIAPAIPILCNKKSLPHRDRLSD